MPGNPSENMLARVSVASTASASQALYTYYSHIVWLRCPALAAVHQFLEFPSPWQPWDKRVPVSDASEQGTRKCRSL